MSSANRNRNEKINDTQSALQCVGNFQKNKSEKNVLTMCWSLLQSRLSIVDLSFMFFIFTFYVCFFTPIARFIFCLISSGFYFSLSFENCSISYFILYVYCCVCNVYNVYNIPYIVIYFPLIYCIDPIPYSLRKYLLKYRNIFVKLRAILDARKLACIWAKRKKRAQVECTFSCMLYVHTAMH